MPASTQTMPATHWLVRALRRSGSASDATWDVQPGVPIAEAWSSLARQAGVTSTELAQAAAGFLSLEAADLNQSDPTASKLLPESAARRYTVYPLRHSDHDVVIAAADPLVPDLEQTLGFLCGRRVVLQVAPPAEIQRMIDTRYSPDRMVDEILGGLRDEDVGMEYVDEVDSVVEDPSVTSMPVVRLTNHILKAAIMQGASDIHLEPDSSGATVRFRSQSQS